MKRKPQPQVIPLNATTKDEAHAEAAEHALRGLVGLWIIQHLHDDGCRAAETQRDSDCRPPCKPEFVLMSYEAHASFMEFDQAMRRIQKAGQN